MSLKDKARSQSGQSLSESADPLHCVLFPTGGLDLIFMPGLGFDKQGNRLGRGRGYYDAYLKRCVQHQHSKPYTLALAFSEQICLQVPMDENDMKVDEVLYEDPSAP